MPNALTPKERLIVALDVPDKDQALAMVSTLDGVVSFYKIGWELFLATGLQFVVELRQRGCNVFLDIKLPDDIDETISRTVRNVVEADVQFITLYGSGRTTRIAKQAKGPAALKILSVTLLTNMDEHDVCDRFSMDHTDFTRKFGTLDNWIVQRATHCLESGCDGIIASGTDVRRIRQHLNHDFFVVCPGIRPSGLLSHEHKREATPTEAIQNGADYLVVGRPIRDANDSRQMAQRIIDEIAEASSASVH